MLEDGNISILLSDDNELSDELDLHVTLQAKGLWQPIPAPMATVDHQLNGGLVGGWHICNDIDYVFQAAHITLDLLQRKIQQGDPTRCLV